MNPNELLRIVDSLHREKNIDSEVVFQAIEAALLTAARRQFGEEAEILVRVDRDTGALQAALNGQHLDEETIGRIGAQTAKQVIIQKIREAERDSLVEEFSGQIDDMVTGVVQRSDGGATVVSLGNVEAILPRSEQIPGETHHPNERIRAVLYEVKPQGSRVKVILSRTRPSLVRRLFEQEIPEIAESVISINAMSREPGYRSKVAVSSSDQRVDCVGACVGVRGNRIKNIVEELAGERIDIVRWSDDPQSLIPNALQPAEVDQVLLCEMLGRAIVLVREDQLSLAIGRRGQNVRLASKLCGWDIEIMTAEELDQQIERAINGFCSLDGMSEELAQKLVEQGYLSYDDLSVIEPEALMEMGGLTVEQADQIVEQAEGKAEEAERAAAAERRRQKELDQLEQMAASAGAPVEDAAGTASQGAGQVSQHEEQHSAAQEAPPPTAPGDGQVSPPEEQNTAVQEAPLPAAPGDGQVSPPEEQDTAVQEAPLPAVPGDGQVSAPEEQDTAVQEAPLPAVPGDGAPP